MSRSTLVLNNEEEPSTMALHRLWTLGRRATAPSNSLFDEAAVCDDIFTPEQEIRENLLKRSPSNCQLASPSTYTCSDPESDYEYEPEIQDHHAVTSDKETETPKPIEETIILDASKIGDIPALYKIPVIENHQMPVVGVYIDPRVTTGFKYRVKPLHSPGFDPSTAPEALFDNRALTLCSIGRGYARRFTFEADPNCLNCNDNYFWSDSRPEGFIFEIEVVSVGDKFTVFDANHLAQGTMEVVSIEGPQIELSSQQTSHGLEKTVKINLTGKVEYYETGVAKPFPITGIVSILKRRGKTAEISKITNVSIGANRKGYILKPGIQRNARRVTVKGKDIGDIPTKYTMTGLEPYEIPVVGTYVDPRIVPGFYYKVRPNDRKEHLFEGRALKLQSIGMGYAKRLTFTPDSLLEPSNYFWSDTHPDGVGLEPRAVHTGMKFAIFADGQKMGEAKVFRADLPQKEEKQEIIELLNKKHAIVKYIHVDVTCHVRLATTGGGAVDQEDHLMRVYGLAVVRKDPGQTEAKVIRLENVGLDSQLNLLFARTHTELEFRPL